MKITYKIKKWISSILQKYGYYVYIPAKINGVTEFEIGEFSYGVNMPSANFAPWRNDKAFKEIFPAVRENTLVDIYKGYELWKLVEEALKISDSLAFIEIGVWRGGTAALISKKMQMKSAKGRLYLADTFTGVVKTGKEDSFYTGGEHDDASRMICEKLFSRLGLNNYDILEGIFPDDTAHLIPEDTEFCFCHIDVDVYLSAKDCLAWVWERLAIGGIVIFDDYGFHRTDGITRLGEEQRQLRDRIFMHNLNGHGVIIKIA